MASQHSNNEPFIIQAAFDDAVARTKGALDENRAKRLLFTIMNDTSSTNFVTALSQAKTVVGVPEIERSRYHSFATMYFKDPRVKKSRKKKQAPVKKQAEDPNWGLISILCEREQSARAMESGENLLSPDWEPEYEGPQW